MEISTLILAVMLTYAKLGCCPIPAVNLKRCQLLAEEKQDVKNTGIVRIVRIIHTRRN